MTRDILLDGKSYTLQIDGTAGVCKFSFSGDGVEHRTGEASVAGLEPGLFSVILNGKSYDVRVPGGGDTVEVNGTAISVAVQDPRSLLRSNSAAAADGVQLLTAAMPGKVVRVLVAAGQEVAAGQGIIVVEAMKMQNEVKAQRAGRVTSVSVQNGELVTAGQPLATLE